MNKYQLLWIVLFMGITVCVSAQRVIIRFDTPLSSPPSVTKAALRYDKDFAYSLTFDDGGIDAFSCALPVLEGGTAQCNGATLTGLSFTDGCGKNLFFKAGLAWNAANAIGQDAHDGRTVGKMTWQQLDAVYEKGWDVFNHSYSHKARATNTLSAQDYITEIEVNRTAVRDKTRNKIEIPLFVVPSGDVIYQSIAYARGQKLVLDQAGTTIGVGGLSVKTDFTPNGQVIHRQLVEDALNSGSDKIGAVANKAINGEKIWYNEFTHGLSGTSGLTFDRFKTHMERIANTWGKNGTDRVWMAPLQEVFEYLTVKQNISYTATISGNQLILDFNMSQLPDWLRRKPLTLVVNSVSNFSTVDVPQNMKMSFKGTGSKKIINLDFTGVAPSTPSTNTVICSSKANAPWNEWLKEVQVGSFINSSDKTRADRYAIGYSDFKDKIISLKRGQKYPLSISSGSDRLGVLNLNYRVWIDFNGNKIFESSEEVLEKLNTQLIVRDSFSVPLSAKLGITTMRVSLKKDAAASPCETFESGEVEDYSVNIEDVVIALNPCDTDKIVPIFTNCPKNSIVSTTTSSSANINFAPLVATDNCATPSVFGSHQPNQVFQLGTTYVGYTARDAKGNEAYCNFYVILNAIKDTLKKADLGLSIKASFLTYRQWTVDTFTITAKNNGATALSNVKIEFKYPNKTTKGGNATPSLGAWREYCPNNLPCFEWAIDNLAPNQTATLIAPIFVLDATEPLVVTTNLLLSTPIDTIVSNNQATVIVQMAVATRRAAFSTIVEKPTQFVPLIIQDISPNPTEGDIMVNVESLLAKNVQFDFFNVFGKSVHSEIKKLTVGDNQLHFDLSNTASGIYCIKSSIGEGQNSPIKFVKL